MKTTRKDMTKIGRLLKRADFLRVQASGKKWVTPTCIVQMASFSGEIALPNSHQCRYGLTVTKKIWKKSVDRNRVRRRVRAVLLGVLADRMMGGKIPAQTDFVILPRSPALTAPIDAIEKDLSWAIKRLTTADQK